MSKEINFLRDRRKTLSKRQKLDIKILKITAVVFGVVLLGFVITFGVSFFYTYSFNKFEAMEQRLTQQIVDNEDTEKLFVVTVHKLKALVGINDKRKNKQQAIEFFSTVFGDEVLVKQIEYSGQDDLLTFRLESKDVFVLEEVFYKLKQPDVAAEFNSIATSNLSRADTGRYQLSVAVVLKPIKS